MSTHNICFYGEIRKIIPELSPNTPPEQFLCFSFAFLGLVRLLSTVSSESDCRSRGRRLESQLCHINFMWIDYKIISTVILLI